MVEKWSLKQYYGSTPVIGPDGIIYFLSGPNVIALNPNDKTTRVVIDFSTNANTQGYNPGAGLTSIGLDGVLYIRASIGDGYTLFIFDSAGSFRGKVKDVGAIPTVGPDGNVYGEYHNFSGVMWLGSFYAYDSFGNNKWSKGGILSNPSFAISTSGKLYMPEYSGLWVVNAADGQILWGYGLYECLNPCISSSPILDAEEKAYIGTPDGRMICLDSSGHLVWSIQLTSSPLGSPLLDRYGTVYVVSGADLLAIEGDTLPNQSPIIDSFSSTPSTGKAPLQVAFTCVAHDPDGAITSYTLDPGDGSTPITNLTGEFQYVYEEPGNYGSTCTVSDSQSSTAISSPKDIVVGAMTTYSLPDTGQTKCYNNTQEIPCPSPGTSFYGQDGNYPGAQLAYQNTDDTVTDLNTGLIWQRGDEQNGSGRTWQEAIDYCAGLELADHSDWRLPTRRELMSLVNYSIPSPGPTIDKKFFPNGLAYYYWSSSARAVNPTGYAWVINFGNGASQWLSKGTTGMSVRCVRNAP